VPRKISSILALVALAVAASAPSATAMNLERLIAPTEVCADQTDLGASVAAQEQAMRCMSNFARERMGMGQLGDAADLNRSARDKSDDILRCDSFSHYACGRQFTYWMQRVGYIPAQCWRAGENLAWGTGDLGTVRAIFRAWIHSPEHRENILGPYDQIGVALAVGSLDGRSDVHVWTQHFGSHCGQPTASAAPRLARLAAGRVVG
jgi:uncharacterized protein YkwD